MLKKGSLGAMVMLLCDREVTGSSPGRSLLQKCKGTISSIMVDRSNHNSMFPEYHGLCSSPGTSHILGSTIVGQSLLRNPALFMHRTSFQSPNVPSSSVVEPKKQLHPSEQNPGFYGIIQATSKVMTALVAAPIERVYILMQCQNEMLKYGHLSSPYKGMKDCFQRIIKQEGFLSLWRGNSINVVTPLTVQAFSFSLLHFKREKKVQEPPSWLLPLGVITGVMFILPLDYTRVRLATDVKAAGGSQFSLDTFGKKSSNAVKDRMFNGVFDVFKKTLKSDGIVGLYRGYTLACFGIFSHYQASRGIKSHYKTEKQTKENLSFSARVAPVALMSLPVVFYPLMTITRRMMMTSGEATKYKGVIDAVCQIVRHEGASALYKGVTPFVIFCLSKDAVMLAFFYFTYSGLHKLAKRVSS